jgi:dolichol-phosphate mannosyltransferase
MIQTVWEDQGGSDHNKPTAQANVVAMRTKSPGSLVTLDVSVVVPAMKEGPNLELLLPQVRAVVESLGVTWEILIVTGETDAQTLTAAGVAGAIVLKQRERGYGGALLTAFDAARGAYLLTMDADLSHRPEFIRDLWHCRESAEVLVASRYVEGGRARMPVSRYVLSRVINLFFRIGLSMPIKDLSSGFRLYNAKSLRAREFTARDFNILQEILIRAYAQGFRVLEVPFDYAPRRHGSSNARVFRFGLAYLRTFGSLWKLRNSIQSRRL